VLRKIAMLSGVLCAASAWAGSEDGCAKGSAEVQDVDRMGEVSWVGPDQHSARVYFQTEPKPCPAKGPCPWRRKAYIVSGDRVTEDAVSGAFSCVTYTAYRLVATPVYEKVGSTRGWVPSEAICLHAALRKKRSDPIPVFDVPGRTECERFTSTLDDDAEAYSGEFRSATASLKVSEATSAQMTAELEMNNGTCHFKSVGTAYVNRPLVVSFDVPKADTDPGPCFATGVFDDAGVHLQLSLCQKPGCENVAEDFLAWQKK